MLSRIGLTRRKLQQILTSAPANILPMTRRHTPEIDASPPIHRCAKDATSLDRSTFHKSISVLAVVVPAAKTGSLLKAEAMRKMVLDLPKTRSVMVDPRIPGPDGNRLVLLRVTRQDQLTPEATQFLAEAGAVFDQYSFSLDYDYWTADEILQAVLPEELCDTSPTGFAIIGHIAHLNLNDEYLPYKHIIGQVVLDKNKKIRTVVNKLDNIHNVFRFFEMELIAGEPDYIVEHHESDCRFTFDFTQVYWNSRLHTEHERLVQQFEPANGIVADVFAGVGPFAVPAAKKGCAVFANDLNPNSAKWLEKNVEDNRVSDAVHVTCQDGRDFIRAVVSRALEDPFPPFAEKASRRQLKEERRRRQAQFDTRGSCRPEEDVLPSHPHLLTPRNWISHFVMNLPDSAIEFLDAFRGILSPAGPTGDLSGLYATLPMVHCHCFTRYLDPAEAEADIRKRVEERLGHALEEDVSLHMVRSVAPNKDMYCISFRLPRQVAFC